MKKHKKAEQNEKKVLLNFIKKTRDGTYSKVDTSATKYIRYKILREPVFDNNYQYDYFENSK